MRYILACGALATAIVVAGCSDLVAPSSKAVVSGLDTPIMFSANGTQNIPVTFVTQFAAFLSGETREHGSSGRSRSHVCLAFTVQEGDLAGTMETCFYNNDPSDQTVSHGIDGWFSTGSPDYSHYEVCMPSKGWCGTFDETGAAGKVYPQPRGVQFHNSVAFGGGDFEGMKMQGSVAECEDSNGDRGCFTGTLQIPGGE